MKFFRFRQFANAAVMFASITLACIGLSDAKSDFSNDFNLELGPSPLELTPSDFDDMEEECWRQIAFDFSHYLGINPPFPIVPDRKIPGKAKRTVLLMYLSKHGLEDFAGCFYGFLEASINRSIMAGEISRLPYCVHSEAGPPPVDVLDAAEELIGYAMRGHGPAITHLSVLHGAGNHLHPDIRYFMKLAVLARYGDKKPWLVDRDYGEVLSSHRELTPMRRDFIEEAFARGDWMAVLDTLDPCAPAIDGSNI